MPPRTARRPVEVPAPQPIAPASVAMGTVGIVVEIVQPQLLQRLPCPLPCRPPSHPPQQLWKRSPHRWERRLMLQGCRPPLTTPSTPALPLVPALGRVVRGMTVAATAPWGCVWTARLMTVTVATAPVAAALTGRQPVVAALHSVCDVTHANAHERRLEAWLQVAADRRHTSHHASACCVVQREDPTSAPCPPRASHRLRQTDPLCRCRQVSVLVPQWVVVTWPLAQPSMLPCDDGSTRP